MTNAAVIIAAIFADNLLLTKLFGIETFFTSSEKKTETLEYGGLTTLVTVLAGIISVIINKYVFSELEIMYMSTFVTALVTLAVLCAVHLVSAKISKGMYVSFTKHMPVISTNCIVIGSVWMCVENSLSIGMSALYLLAAGVGFSLVLLVFSSASQGLKDSAPPASFRGIPILLITAAIAAMAFAGFLGVGA